MSLGTRSTFGIPFGGNTIYQDSRKPPFTFISPDAAKREIRIDEARSSYEGEAAMKPELVWIDPPVLRAPVLAFGG